MRYPTLVGQNYIKCENVRDTKIGGCKNGSTILIEINEYYTMASGTCYEIKSNFQIIPFDTGAMLLYVNESLHYDDFPEVCLKTTKT